MQPAGFQTGARASSSSQWFQVQPDSMARLRLFCFPYAGGGSATFRPWTRQVPRSIEVVPALLPGREFRLRESAFTRMEPMVEALAREIVPFLDRPFAFFGHSMGGSIGFELARRLRAERGLEPDHLFISGRRAPQLPEQTPEIHNLPEPEFIAELEKMNGTPREVLEHAELMEMLIPLLRADFEVSRMYHFVPGDPLRCPITVFGGKDDETATREQLEAWRPHTSSACRVYIVDGDHFFINQQQAAILPIILHALRAYT